MRDLDPHLIQCSLGLHESVPKSHLDWFSSAIYAQVTHMSNTQTTLYATGIGKGNIYSLCAGGVARKLGQFNSEPEIFIVELGL